MKPASVIFDFDSTLIQVESLEHIFKDLTDVKALERLRDISHAAMNGELSFAESLAKRLAVVELKLEQVLLGAKALKDFLSPGMAQLIAELHQSSVDVWILSGGLREILFEVGSFLSIPKERIFGVELSWRSGFFHQILASNPFNESKLKGAKSLQFPKRPVIMVGDGFNDFEVFQAGVADHLVVYTENVRREKVLAQALPLGAVEAENAAALRSHLLRILS